jgi:hypothetical protein
MHGACAGDIPDLGIKKKTRIFADSMREIDKYKVVAALVRGFFEAFTSGVIDCHVSDRHEKTAPKTIKQTMLNHYGSIAREFHDQLTYTIATMNYDMVTIAAKVREEQKNGLTPERLLRVVCTDDAMHQAVVTEYKRNFALLLNGRYATAQEHFDNYTRNTGEKATIDTTAAIRMTVKTVIESYVRGVRCSMEENARIDRVTILLLLINTMNLLLNDEPLGEDAAEARDLNDVLLKACRTEGNIKTLLEEMDATFTRLAKQ